MHELRTVNAAVAWIADRARARAEFNLRADTEQFLASRPNHCRGNMDGSGSPTNTQGMLMPGGGPCTTGGWMVTRLHWLCSPHSSYARFSASSLLLPRAVGEALQDSCGRKECMRMELASVALRGLLGRQQGTRMVCTYAWISNLPTHSSRRVLCHHSLGSWNGGR